MLPGFNIVLRRAVRPSRHRRAVLGPPGAGAVSVHALPKRMPCTVRDERIVVWPCTVSWRSSSTASSPHTPSVPLVLMSASSVSELLTTSVPLLVSTSDAVPPTARVTPESGMKALESLIFGEKYTKI